MSAIAVFQPKAPEGFEWVAPCADADFEVFRGFDGTSRQAEWKPVRVRVLRYDDPGGQLRSADLPWLGAHVLVLSSEAANLLRPVLEPFGEFLPLSCDDADLCVYNALFVVDALDEGQSELVRFSTGRLLKIVRPCFRPEMVQGLHVFKVPQMLRGPLFVTAEVVDAVREAGLYGTEFEQVWAGLADFQSGSS